MRRQPDSSPPAGGPLRKLAALLLGAVLVVLGVMFSVVLLAILLTVGLAVWTYLWWRTRKLRRDLAQGPQAMGRGHVIEGEAVVIHDPDQPPPAALSGISRGSIGRDGAGPAT